MRRKTDSKNPADWIYFAESDMAGVQALVKLRVGHLACQSKLAEVLEKILKAELIRLGWALVKTHDLQLLAKELRAYKSDIYEPAKSLCATLAERYFTDRYPGFDVDDTLDWVAFEAQVNQVANLLEMVKSRVRTI